MKKVLKDELENIKFFQLEHPEILSVMEDGVFSGNNYITFGNSFSKDILREMLNCKILGLRKSLVNQVLEFKADNSIQKETHIENKIDEYRSIVAKFLSKPKNEGRVINIKEKESNNGQILKNGISNGLSSNSLNDFKFEILQSFDYNLSKNKILSEVSFIQSIAKPKLFFNNLKVSDLLIEESFHLMNSILIQKNLIDVKGSFPKKNELTLKSKEILSFLNGYIPKGNIKFASNMVFWNYFFFLKANYIIGADYMIDWKAVINFTIINGKKVSHVEAKKLRNNKNHYQKTYIKKFLKSNDFDLVSIEFIKTK